MVCVLGSRDTHQSAPENISRPDERAWSDVTSSTIIVLRLTWLGKCYFLGDAADAPDTHTRSLCRLGKCCSLGDAADAPDCEEQLHLDKKIAS